MPRFNVRLFAAHREAAGKPSVTIELGQGSRVRDARAALQREAPALAAAEGVTVIAVNGKYAHDDQPLRAGDDLAAFPPVAGG